MPAISVTNLVKSYGGLRAVDGLSFTVEEGSCVALLGPNGAGKTTTVEILEGHRRPDSGEVSVLGFDPATGGRAYRERIGIVLQEAGIEEEFSVRELLRLQRGMYPRRRDVDEVIALVGLEGKADARVKTLSGGQKRRLDLALGLIGDPELVFLDEPTTGFDPEARRRAWEIVEGLKALGRTILLTTHYMDEAQHLADRVLVIRRGRLVAEGTPAELGERMAGSTVIAFRLPAASPVDALASAGLQGAVQHVAGGIELHTTAATADLHALTAWALEQGVELGELQVRRPSLEDVYLGLVGEDD